MADGLATEEAIDELDARIGMIDSPEETALAELKAHQEASGMTFADPGAPVLPDPATSWRDEEVR